MKRLSAAEYQQMAAAYPSKRKVPKRQQETVEVKSYIKFLNDNNFGFFYRVKSAGTFDPVRKTFRKNTELVGIPDIVGFTNKPAIPAYIEAKRVINVESKKKLIFSAKITMEQKDFLLRAHRAGCIAGVAFNLKDVISIVSQDQVLFPRHPRTFFFLPLEELKAYAEEYRALIAAHAASAQDPVVRHVKWNRPSGSPGT